MANKVVGEEITVMIPKILKEWITLKSKEDLLSEQEWISGVLIECIEEKIAREGGFDLVDQLIRNLRRF